MGKARKCENDSQGSDAATDQFIESMKPKFWNVFIAIVIISSIPLAFLTFFFFSNKQFGWVSNLSLGKLFLFGLIGGVRGFIICGIQKQPSLLSNYLKPRQPVSNYKRILLGFSFLVSCVAMAGFVYGVLFLVNGGGDIQVNNSASFLIPKPGQYTLWASSENMNDTSVSTLASQLQIAQDQGNKIVQRQPLFMQVVYRNNGEKYLGICNFQFPTSGSYHLLMSSNQGTEKIILHRSAWLGVMLLTLFSFLVGSSSMLFCVYLVWSGRIVLSKLHERTVG
jgi:hypothetical protein